MPRKLMAGSAAILCMALATPTLAHHSFVMFDLGKTSALTGTVKTFEMINPHGWLQLMVADDQGKTSEWAIETAPPGRLQRSGIKNTTLKPGDKVSVTIHPLKDGSNGGQLLSVTLANGKTLMSDGPPPGNRS